MGRPDALTVTQVAEKLNVSTYTVRREIAEGRIPTLPFGGRVVRVPARFVDDLLASVARSVS